jgi:hypothetical protein
VATVLLAVGDAFRRRRTDLYQRVLHFLDHHADDLFRIFGLFQQGIEVRVDDVTQSGKNTHWFAPAGITPFAFFMQASCQPILRIASI